MGCLEAARVAGRIAGGPQGSSVELGIAGKLTLINPARLSHAGATDTTVSMGPAGGGGKASLTHFGRFDTVYPAD